MADETGHFPRRPSRILKATLWSLQWLKAAWLHESSFRLEVYLLAVLGPLALWLGGSGVEGKPFGMGLRCRLRHALRLVPTPCPRKKVHRL